MARNADRELGRAEFYGSQRFRTAATEIFGEGAVETLDLMLRMSAFPGSSEPSADVIAHEATLVLAAMATRAIRPPWVADAARSVLAMDYQLEYGPNATSDRKGLRDDSQPPQKDYFGTQLAMGFRRTRQTSDAALKAHWPFAVAIGWTAFGECIGLIHYPRKGTTFAYSRAHLLKNNNPGIVRLTSLEFDLPAKFEASESMIERLGRLMFGMDHGDRGADAVVARRSIDG